ncbi:hypothetical protein PGT21_034923 [Puccinia graminis f. sp. tritici]|uniref:Uncharacterized protein n=1 Tax=Puccinia graminis f. sp. tritici TaxID=56615 RepID=A0A5B0MHD8_PUCGR|nr:hypothetical protein PGT21_034923 [Puccinia graminis f. sp. tritici]
MGHDSVVNQPKSLAFYFFRSPIEPPTLVCEVKKSRRIIPESSPKTGSQSSSDLSSLSSESETKLEVEDNQTLVPPRNGNLVSSQAWTQISTSGNPKKKKNVPREFEPTRYPEWTPEVSTYLNKPKKTKKRQNKKKSKGLSLTLEFLPHSRYPLVAITNLDSV